MKKKSLIISSFLLLAFLCSSSIQAQKKEQAFRTNNKASSSATIDNSAAQWAEEQMAHMSLEEQIGQLMFVRVPLTMTKKQQREFEKNFSKLKVGGVCFFKGTATNQLERTRRYQKMSEVPLMVTIDAEWGLGMRLTDCYSFPRQMLMGALSPKNDSLIALFGEEVGRQCRKMGIHVNFAPVCDINSNPRNPVIGCRSFGENKKNVARKSALYALAMQRMGVIAVGKHFPGHGDTDVDSHLDLPIIKHSKDYIDSVDLFPFRHLVKKGIRGMMIAHLQVDAYDSRLNMPSSLSELIVTPLLRNEMGFNGLIFTDGIDMKAVSNNYKDGEGAIRAIRAGSDVILLPIDVEKTIDALHHEAKHDKAFRKMIEDRCQRILQEKYRCGLAEMRLDKLATPSKEDAKRCKEITRQMAAKALTLVLNEDYTLPLRKDEPVVKIAVGACDTAITKFDTKLEQRIRNAGTVVISLFGNLSSAKNYGVSDETIALVNSIAAIDNVKSVLVIYGSPYILESFPKSSNTLPDAIVMAYQNMAETVEATAPALVGDSPFEGKLPVSTGGYREGSSLKAVPRPETSPYDELRKVGMDDKCFVKIDSIANEGIRQKAYPGCQILVAKDGKIVYNRCYGKLTYNASSPDVDSNTVYDLASLTKVSATNLAVMKLVDAGKLSLDDKLSKYLPYLKRTNKKNITVREALSHYARLKAFDAYWKTAEESGNLYVGTNPPHDYTQIGDNTYIKNSFKEGMLLRIAVSKLEKEQRYLYSDLGFILLADVVERISGQSLDIFMQQQFYSPLQMQSTCFQPLQHGIDIARIAPTEEDKAFRKQLIRGYVHDPNAAAMGGVAGHAGLFSTASDLFKLYQMMLDSGSYNGHQYVSAKTFNTFNSRHYAEHGNRRALGFDKPLINGRSSHVTPMASQSSFGHTGFTGTMVWVDPQYNLVYIFLSNRVYPNSSPNKLANMNIRTDIQELIYKSLPTTSRGPAK